MSKIDEKYINALENFTGALEEVVKTLREQQDNKKIDTVNEMLKNMPDQLKLVVEDLKKVTIEGFKSVKSDNDKILKGIDSIKKQKEAGMFDKIEDPKNKNKIVDGIKIVVLIAAGVLAMGMAFKIIGKIDPISVLALGVAIGIMVVTFAKVLETTKDISIGKILTVSGMLVVMALAITASSKILISTAPIGLKLMGSIIFTSLALGGALFFITKSLDNIKISARTIVGLLLLPILAPIVASSIVKSSVIFKNTAYLDFKTMLSITFTSIAIGTALYLLTKSINSLKLSFKTILGFMLLPILAPIVAGVITKSSHIFKNAATIPFSTILSITFTSIALGVALYAISVAVSKMNLKPSVIGMLTKGAVFGLLVAAVAMAIVKASQEFKNVVPISLMQGLTVIFVAVTLGIALFAVSLVAKQVEGMSFTKALAVGALMVVVSWALKKSADIIGEIIPFSFAFSLRLILTTVAIGIALYVFSYAWKRFAANMVTLTSGGIGVGKPSDSKTVKTIVAAAVAIVLVSQILRLGNYDGPVPGLEWTFKVGIALVAFGIGMAQIGKLPFDNVAKGFVSVLLISLAINVSSKIIADGKYENAPPLDWIMNVGISIVIFGSSMALLGYVVSKVGPANFALGVLATLAIAPIIFVTSWILNQGEYDAYPKTEWLIGVGLSLVVFGTIMGILGIPAVATSVLIGVIPILAVAGTIWLVDKIISAGEYKTFPKKDWLLNVGLTITTFSLIAPLALLGMIGAIGILAVAGTIWLVDKIISQGEYKTFPKLEWAQSIGLTLFSFGTSMALFGGFGLGTVALLFGAASMAIIAGTIVEVSNILSKGKYTGGPTYEWSIGMSELISSVGSIMVIIGMIPFGGKVLKWGKERMEIIADAIKLTSIKLAGGKYTGGPTYEWASGVGTAISAFAEGISVMGKATGGLKTFFVGIDPMQMRNTITFLVSAMVEANTKLGKTVWTKNVPSKKWAEGVGIALSKFAEAARVLFGGTLESDITGQFVSTVGILMDGLIAAGKKMDESKLLWKYIQYPKSEWVSGVGDALTALVDLSRSLQGGWFSGSMVDTFVNNVDILAKGVINLGTAFDKSKINWSTLDAPNKDFIEDFEGSSSVLLRLVKTYENIDLSQIDKFGLKMKMLIPTIVIIFKMVNDIKVGTVPDASYVEKVEEFIKLTKRMITGFNVDMDKLNKFNIGIRTVLATLIITSQQTKLIGDIPDVTKIQNFDKIVSEISKILDKYDIDKEKSNNFNIVMRSIITTLVMISTQGKLIQVPPDINGFILFTKQLSKIVDNYDVELKDSNNFNLNIRSIIATLVMISTQGKLMQTPPSLKGYDQFTIQLSSIIDNYDIDKEKTSNFNLSIRSILATLVMISTQGKLLQSPPSLKSYDKFTEQLSKIVDNYDINLENSNNFNLSIRSIIATLVMISTQGKLMQTPPSLKGYDKFTEQLSKMVDNYDIDKEKTSDFNIGLILIMTTLVMISTQGKLLQTPSLKGYDKFTSQLSAMINNYDVKLKDSNNFNLSIISILATLVMISTQGKLIQSSPSLKGYDKFTEQLSKIVDNYDVELKDSNNFNLNIRSIIATLVMISTQGKLLQSPPSLKSYDKFTEQLSKIVDNYDIDKENSNNFNLSIRSILATLVMISTQGKLMQTPPSLKDYDKFTEQLSKIVDNYDIDKEKTSDFNIGLISIIATLVMISTQGKLIQSSPSLKGYDKFTEQLSKIVDNYDIDKEKTSDFNIGLISIIATLVLISQQGKFIQSPPDLLNYDNFTTQISMIVNNYDISKEKLDIFVQDINLIISTLIFISIQSAFLTKVPDIKFMSDLEVFVKNIVKIISDYKLDYSNVNLFNITMRTILTTLVEISKISGLIMPSYWLTDRLIYFLTNISESVLNWKPTVEQSVNFNSSIGFIVLSIKLITEIPQKDVSFYNSTIYIRLALAQISQSVKDFNDLKFSLVDLEKFYVSMRLVVSGIEAFAKMPKITNEFLENTKLIKKSLKELSEGVDPFMSSRSMIDFLNFSNGLRNIIQGLKIMAELKPIPDTATNSFKKFLDQLNKMPDKMFAFDAKVNGIKKLADSLLTLATALNTLGGSLDGFLNMSKGLFLISIIDDVKLGNVLDSVQKHQNTLQVINKVPDEQAGLSNMINKLYDFIPKITPEKPVVETVTVDTKQEAFYSDISEIKIMMSHLLEHLDRPTQTGSFSN
jgi:hypothetical protein